MNMNKLRSILVVAILAMIVLTACEKGEPEISSEPSMTFTSALAVGEEIELYLEAADDNVWIDLNNNGKKDKGEEAIFGDDATTYILGARTITVYGNVTLLDCRNNLLTSLDVSKNTMLESLFCFENRLTSLDLSKNTMLRVLVCHDNRLTSLDVSKNTMLTYLHLYNNKLTSLDVSYNKALKYLICPYNKLTSLDVSQNTALEDLCCDVNSLTSLDVSKNTALKWLDCRNNQLTLLDVSQNKELIELLCNDNQISGVNMDKLVISLPDRTGKEKGGFYVIAHTSPDEQNVCTVSQAKIATDKNWDVLDASGFPYSGS